jgi:hypothetical protein
VVSNNGTTEIIVVEAKTGHSRNSEKSVLNKHPFQLILDESF